MTFHSYTWDAYGHVSTIATPPNGSTTSSVVYDANGNKVEENVSGTIHEYVSAFGVTAQMTGQTENSTIIPLPGGVQALYSGGALQRFRFPDWQGSIRAESNPSTRAFTESLAFAPFGERYALKGAPFNVDSFTGKPDQLVPDEYDFPAREEHNGQGRWTSPDPMRGTGNKYVYADNNPLSNVDLYGLFPSNEGVDYNADDGISSDPSSEPFYQPESHPPVSVQTNGQVTGTPSAPATSATTQTPQSQQQELANQSQQQSQAPKQETPCPVSACVTAPMPQGPDPVAVGMNMRLFMMKQAEADWQVVWRSQYTQTALMLIVAIATRGEGGEGGEIGGEGGKADPQSEPGAGKDRSPGGTEQQLKDMEREQKDYHDGIRKRPVDSIEKSRQNFKKAVRDNPKLEDWEQ